MKTWGLLLAFLAAFSGAFGAHIRGGEITYKYLGAGPEPGSSKYELTLKLYVDCRANSPGQLDDVITFTIFNRGVSGSRPFLANAPFSSQQIIEYDPGSNPCILNPPTDICYRLRYYKTTIALLDNAEGYTVGFQRCCRIANIENVSGNSGVTGATYSCDIPGTNNLASAPKNSSPILNPNDAIAICAGAGFTFDFSAVDPDGTDSLVYALCEAFVGGGTEPGDCFDCTSPAPASNPPFRKIGYRSGFSGGSPLGSTVSFNSKTGRLSGIAPKTVGQYVLTACVSEYRQGILINTHRKDIHISVSNCKPLKAFLQPDYTFCDDFNVTFENGQVNPDGSTYVWTYGDGSKPDTVKTALGSVQHQYKDTGAYTVKLFITLANGQCADEATTVAKVYPGFNPDFSAAGSCLLIPFRFTDQSTTRFGFVNNWTWDFGDETVTTDISTAPNPNYKYNSLGQKTVSLTVGSNKGCLKTITKLIEVKDKPTLLLNFKDTLICSIDQIQLSASSPGSLAPVFTWSPLYNIINPNSPNPIVYPKTTTRYKVSMTDNGCAAEDSMLVRVVDEVTLSVSPDSTICLTDAAQIEAFGDGLKYVWSPAATILNAQVRNPLVTPAGSTTYSVISSIGSCTKTASININTIPYPVSDAGPDVIICYDDSTQLQGSMIASAFTWSPTGTLINPTTLSPIAFPLRSTNYILTVTDILGCPKPVSDTIRVTVQPPVRAFAGNDTAIVVGQPLQLRATGGEFYAWSPPTGLNFTNIATPVAILSLNQTYAVRVSTPGDCFAFDTINVVVFKTNPDIFVPNAFTPGGSSNTIFRPKPVGISFFEFFRVYNRYGQLVFSTSEAGKGWDGKIAGVDQGSNTYVWMVKGRDFTGKTIFKKGTMVLIR
jgi:gliding motility-associated-like protein